MKKGSWQLVLSVTMALMVALSGCGGSGGGSTPTSDTGDTGGDTPASTTITRGIAVDPYILGAVFQEVDAEGNILQTSAPSNESGEFVFDKALQQGSIIKMSAKGVHNGVPFKGNLKRKVDAAEGALVASPITTLLADEGRTPAEVIKLLSDAAGVELSEEELTANPMAGFEQDATNERARKIVAASVALNAAVVANNGSTDPVVLKAPIATLATKINEVLENVTVADAPASPESALSTAVAVSDFIVEKVLADSSFTVDAVAGTITNEVIASTIAAVGAVDGATAYIEETDGVIAPVVNTTTVRGFLDKAFVALNEGTKTSSSRSVLAAAGFFEAAVAAIDYDATATAADKDTANFFGGLAKIATLANPFSDAQENGLNNLGDILDAFGATADRSKYDLIGLKENCVEAVDENGTVLTNPYDSSSPYLVCEVEIPEGAPTTGDLQKFMYNDLSVQLKTAMEMFGKISDNFNNTEWTPPQDTTPTEFDNADALFFKGLAQSMLAQINIQQAYDVDVDLYDVHTSDTTTEQFLTQNPTLGQLQYAAKLAEAKTYIAGAIDDLTAAVKSIQAETDDNQQDDFLSFYTETCTWIDSDPWVICSEDPEAMDANLEETLTNLALAKQALTEHVTVGDGENLADPSDDKIVDFGAFFDGIDLRGQIPTFTGNKPSLFPDPAFDGLLVQGFDLNRDWDADDSPDVLVGYTQFSEKIVQELQPLSFQFQQMESPWNSFWISNCVTDGSDFTCPVSSSQETVSGTWAVKSGELVLTKVQGPDIFQTLTLTLEGGSGDETGDDQTSFSLYGTAMDYAVSIPYYFWARTYIDPVN
ncbi:MAG: hypothetical protein AB7F21_03165 [Desulfuromonadales bacterium]